MKHPRQSSTDWLWSRQEGKRGKFTERLQLGASSGFRPSLALAWNASRLRNMILTVGPYTPAAQACLASLHDRSDDSDEDEDEDEEEEDDDNESDSEMEQSHVNSANHVQHNDSEAEEITGDEQPDRSEDEEEEDISDSRRHNTDHRRGRPTRRNVQSVSDQNETISVDSQTQSEEREEEEMNIAYAPPPATQRSWVPLIRHESCINTACWLDVPWRLSITDGKLPSPIESWEEPTQLITSGDDRLVKFWDVRYAMGSTSPLSGGWDVFTPFSTPGMPSSSNLTSKNLPHHKMPPGAVIPLASVVSGHLGNVFHVTPIPSRLGEVLTCGADGQLRKCHVERHQSSELVMRPRMAMEDSSDYDDFGMQFGMAYSHQLLTEHTGLLCCDRGLFHFDMRLSSRDQSRQPFKLSIKRGNGWRSHASTIKACAVWSPSLGTEHARQGYLVDSNYIFAGGTGADVHLFDLRMGTGGHENSRVIERYRPRMLSNEESVSVSGIDVSKDGRELLVSYESDQIYTVPILNGASSPAGPTLEEIDGWSSSFLEDPLESVPDMACYGAHLNRFTFLKSARYAGPNDEYIATGSDSGHAWIYRKSDGAVASLLSADTHVCNGVVPHPTLPFFITYGIDSTAKLWRATIPIETETNDSSHTRSNVALSRPYQMSPMVKNPEQVQKRCSLFDSPDMHVVIFPDYIPTVQEILCAGRFMSNMLWAMAGGYEGAPRIGNSLRTLPLLLRSNRYECCLAAMAGDERPLEGSLDALTKRLSYMRLQHQADQLGLIIDDKENPYLWRVPDSLDVHPADLVPDFPSDWIPMDPLMNQEVQYTCPNFTLEQHPTASIREQIELVFGDDFADITPKTLSRYPWLEHAGKEDETDFWWPSVADSIAEKSMGETESESGMPSKSFSVEDRDLSRKILFYTALLCKEGGNVAMKEKMFETAARRYDKAIQYCAVAFLNYEGSKRQIPHLTAGLSVRIPMGNHGSLSRRDAYVYTWCPLLRVWIGCHLNLALLFLKPVLSKFQGDARQQAEIALKLVSPYTKEVGKVYYGGQIIREDEPHETYQEAIKLQAKAYFRLGSAEMEQGDFVSATKSFESSIASTDGPVEAILHKRLLAARSRTSSQKKRNRKRFELALGATANPETSSAAADR